MQCINWYIRLYVWAHHMYTVVWMLIPCIFYSSTMIIAVQLVLRFLVVSNFMGGLYKNRTPILFV